MLQLIISGPLPPPTNFAVPRQSPATSISLTWDQPLGADAVNSFKITYTYEINECRDENPLPFPPVTVTLNNCSLRGYTIINSSLSPVDEDSVFTISVTSVNSVTESNPSNTATTTTDQAGKHFLCLHSKPLHISHLQHLVWFNLSTSVLLASQTSQFSGTV